MRCGSRVAAAEAEIKTNRKMPKKKELILLFQLNKKTSLSSNFIADYVQLRLSMLFKEFLATTAKSKARDMYQIQTADHTGRVFKGRIS